jgi:predicted  nucleic acid-binding Zn-ribbon protein
MPLPGMPEDLKSRVIEANNLLDAFEQRLGELEANISRLVTGNEIKELRHDFNNARTVINSLMTEIDQRDPIRKQTTQAPKKEGPDGKR